MKPGVKQTEAGAIPQDWDLCTFGRLFAEPSRNGIYKPSEYQGRGMRIVNMGEMFGFEFISNQEMSRVSLTTREYSAFGLQDGDLLFGRRSVVPSGAGKCSLVVLPSEPITFESSIIRVRLDKKCSLPLFYYYFFASSAGRSLVGSIVSGTNVKGIRATELRELNVPILSFPEQEAIASALGDADALIESLERLIAKKRDVKQGAMQELLTARRRLPGFTGKWETKRLGEIGVFLKGSGVKKDEAQDGTLPCIRYGEIYTTHEYIVRTFCSWISHSVALTATRLQSGDILFAGSGETKEEIGKCAAFVGSEEAYAGGDIVILRPFNSDSCFLGYYLNSVPINKQKASMGQGDAIVHIGTQSLASIAVVLPSPTEQTAIAAVLSDMDAELAALEAKLSKARAIKQGMMQELLTGRIRLK